MLIKCLSHQGLNVCCKVMILSKLMVILQFHIPPQQNHLFKVGETLANMFNKGENWTMKGHVDKDTTLKILSIWGYFES